MQKFEVCYDKFENDWICHEFKRVEAKIPDYFWKISASSTGKYHPIYAIGEGGLYRHTFAAFKIADDLLHLDCYQQQFDSVERDFIRAATLLHDCCKKGQTFEHKYTQFEHPLLASEFIREICINDREGDDLQRGMYFADGVCPLVESHMGQFNTSKYSKYTLPTPKTPAQVFVHTCDYLASRKYIEIIGVSPDCV